MNHGKETCRILKELRYKIAEANDIALETSECRFKGDCTGTCPRCESEVRYLERQIANRRRAGNAVRLAGLAAGAIIMSGCGNVSDSKPTETLLGEVVDTIIAEEMCDTVVQTKENNVSNIENVSQRNASKDSVKTDTSLADSNDPDFSLINSIDFGEIEDGHDPIYSPPTFPGGEIALERFINRHIIYPDILKDEAISGSVIVEVTIDVDGKVTEPVVISGLDPVLDRQALKIASLLPDFSPATLDHSRVKSIVKLAIDFKAPVAHESKDNIQAD